MAADDRLDSKRGHGKWSGIDSDNRARTISRQVGRQVVGRKNKEIALRESACE